MRHLIQTQVTALCPKTQIQSRQDVEKSEELGRLVPGITDEPLVGTFAGQDDFLAIGVNALGEFEQCTA